MQRTTDRPVRALAIRALALAAGLLALPLAGPARAAAGDASCGEDPARPEICRFELAAGIAIEADCWQTPS